MNKQCDYGTNSMITPNLDVNKLVDKKAANYLKRGCNKSFETLNLYVKISNELEYYLIWKYPGIYAKLNSYKCSTMNPDCIFHSARLFLYSQPDAGRATHIVCNYCNMNCCDFHLAYGGYKFFTCANEQCTTKLVACGWCLCNNSYIESNYKCLSCMSYKRDCNSKMITDDDYHSLYDQIVDLIDDKYEDIDIELIEKTVNINQV